ncbi:MAG: DnaD domain protein [Lachnospiraceae bacterium]|nr:DnaD domain protein [Lachnospiraceae bacterium]
MGIRLGSDSAEAETKVPNVFIDEYMGDANGEYVKIYLYLLRCMSSREETVSITRMADKFDHTEKDVRRALLYWEKVKLLRLDLDEEERIIGITLVDTEAPARRKKKADNVTLKRDRDKALLPEAEDREERPYYTKDDITRFGREEAFRELVFVAESLFGRTLSRTDLNTILYWYDGLALSLDLIEYLIEYCAENGHKNIRYMDKVALAWKERGIESVEEARAEAQAHSRLYNRVMKAFGITGRSLAESELAYVEKWKKEYGFSDEIILEACRRTIAAISRPGFEYADGILSRWKQKDAMNLEEIRRLDQEHQERSRRGARAEEPAAQSPRRGYNIHSQHTYDYARLEEQYEKQLLKKVGK